MWVVSLDEGGHFEQHELKYSKNRIVGGTVYICNTPQGVEKEAERLEGFFRSACERNNCSFPYDLHYNRKNGEVVNGNNCNSVKATLLAELSDFLRGTGAWKENPPIGHYELYAIVGDSIGMDENLYCSNLSKDDQASNRYEHMAYRVIKNLLFYNLHATDDSVRLDLATRVYNAEKDEALRNGADRIGANSIGGNKDIFRATTAESYRAMLLESIADSNRRNIQVNLNVDKIDYDKYDCGQAFLYLADTICSGYETAIRDAEGCGAAVKNLVEYSNSLLGKDRGRFWAYNEIDIQYRNALNFYRQEADFDALKTICTIRKKETAQAQMYDILWLKDIENKIIQNHKPKQQNADLLDDYIHSKEYDLSVVHGILDGLYAQVQAAKLENDEKIARYLCTLGKSEMTYYNHTGQSEKAEECHQKTASMMHYLPVEEAIDLRNMRSVDLLDALQFEEAIAYTNETAEYAQMLSEIKNAIYPDVEDRNLIIGRTYSQLGQCYAFHQEYEKAVEEFKRAIDCFGSSAGDISITHSYMLHALIECKNLARYQEEAAKYFGADDLEKQLNTILALEPVPQKFALYIYTKALYFLYRNQLEKEFVRKAIKRIDKAYQQVKDNHPWEMIFKYCVLLGIAFAESEEKKLIQSMTKKMEECVSTEKSAILKDIIREANEQIAAARNHQSDVLKDSKLSFMHR